MKFNLKNRPKRIMLTNIDFREEEWFMGFEKELREWMTERQKPPLNKLSTSLAIEEFIRIQILGETPP